RPSNAEARYVEPRVLGVAQPGAGAEIGSLEIPGAAFEDAPSAIAAACRPVSRGAGVGLVPAILDPLADVAGHVEQTVGVRGESSDVDRLALIVAALALLGAVIEVRLGRGDAFAVGVARGGAGAGGIFPFGFR